ncbi:MAG: hypothetical protein Q9225_006764 [Loekoesia sp. 1 TL-2023]
MVVDLTIRHMAWQESPPLMFCRSFDVLPSVALPKNNSSRPIPPEAQVQQRNGEQAILLFVILQGLTRGLYQLIFDLIAGQTTHKEIVAGPPPLLHLSIFPTQPSSSLQRRSESHTNKVNHIASAPAALQLRYIHIAIVIAPGAALGRSRKLEGAFGTKRLENLLPPSHPHSAFPAYFQTLDRTLRLRQVSGVSPRGMALDLQVGFLPRRATSPDSTPTASSCPSLRRYNSSSGIFTNPANTGLPDNDDKIHLSDPPPCSRFGTDSTARWLASAKDVPAFTPPIDISSAITRKGEDEEREKSKIDKASSQDTDPSISSLANFLKNRKTSITFDPQVKLESGHQTALEQPLPKLAVDTARKSRPLVPELSNDSIRSPLSRAYSDADRSRFNSQTGELQSPRFHPTNERGHYPALYPSIDARPRDSEQIDILASGSLTSESTASSGVPEAPTPTDSKMETCLVSPVSVFPPFYQPTSLENTSAWPKPRRRTSASRSKSYSIESRLARRQGSRQGSTTSRRSTSSSMSPATTFLSRFAREEAIVEPDGEGQEVGEYILGKQIGFGGFSVVREAFTLEGDERVVRAVKIVRKQVSGKEDIENEQLQAEFEHEVGLWRCLAHRNILPLLAVYVTDFATFCFTKLNTGGTLFDLVRNNRQGISQDLARRYSYQLASAVRYLHEDMHIVHRDIKLENCLIDVSVEHAAKDGGNLLLCDFGLAEFATNDNGRNSPDPYEAAADRPKPRNIGPSDTSTSIAGSLQYASPELIMSPAGFLSSVVDVWAFGVVVYALLVGDLPFQHTFQPRVQMKILAGEWDEEALRTAEGSRGMEDEVLDIMHGCLDMNSDERWDIAKILKSGWLKGCQEMLEEISEQWKL